MGTARKHPTQTRNRNPKSNLDEVVKIFRRNDWMEVVKESSFARCMKADLEIGCGAVSEAETPSCSYVVLLR